MNNLIVNLVLVDIASLLKIKGANNYKIRAYENAIAKIKNLDVDIKDLVDKGELTEISGIGKSLANTIQEIISTGSCKEYDNLIKEYPPSIIPLLKVSGIGPSKVKLLYNKLNIEDLEDLKRKAELGQLTQISGIGAKTEGKILSSVNRLLDETDKLDLGEASLLSNKLKTYLYKFKDVHRIKAIGSLARREEIINKISLIIECRDFQVISKNIKILPIISEILEENNQKLILNSKLGVKIELIRASSSDFWNKIFWLTGTEEYNKKLKGVFSIRQGDLENKFESEKDIFNKLNIPYIIPELRSDLEIVDRAREDSLPLSIKKEDIKGDLHIHSNWSDGRYTIEEMARACQNRGYEYLSICDHTHSLTIANGLDVDRLKRQWEEIDKLNEELNIRILKGAEVDILNDSLDYGDNILESLDVVIASIHSGFGDSQEDMMKRIMMALNNPYVDILGHPTGRLILGRASYNIDFEKLVHKAVETNTILEINSAPKRLDLNSHNVKLAHKLGAKFIINTDAHKIKQLDNMEFGVGVARKGWLEKEDLVNTLSLSDFKDFLTK
ncbi:DNA polymerase/3'-5' exonuclease PolX [Orenia marismortui]|uniref:DNA polymerase/3'-5' exonuclease PolX n=1 Tax=Orenia marismortui TaxID=46469 RepID=UPI0003711E6A|nr:DNA polymerase/3'-5' exonuclease PolX [Orenia marismortui]